MFSNNDPSKTSSLEYIINTNLNSTLTYYTNTSFCVLTS